MSPEAIVAIGGFIDKYGLPILALIVGGWVVREIVVKAIWPYFLTTQAQARADREQERKDRITERDLFLGTLASFNANLISRETTTQVTMKEILTALRAISNEVKDSKTRPRSGEKKP